MSNFLLYMIAIFVEGKELVGALRITLVSSIWLSHRFAHVPSWSDLGILCLNQCLSLTLILKPSFLLLGSAFSAIIKTA